VFGGLIQYLPDITLLRIRGTNRILTVRQIYVPIQQQINNHFCFAQKTMNVPRFVVLRIGDKSHILESARGHCRDYNLSGFGFKPET